MFLLGSLSYQLDSGFEAMLDAGLLVLLSTPVIYSWVIKPYVVARDIAIEQVTHMAFHDPLTQLANRRLLFEYLGKMTSSISRHGICGALLLVDLDGFKTINDHDGHDIGDEILVEIARRLKLIIRGEDVACRLGGDEFVILLSQLDTDKQVAKQMALAIAGRFQNAINEPINLNKTFHLSASIGLRLLGIEDATLLTIVKEADIAMYRAKRAGKGCTMVFDEKIDLSVADI